MIPVCAGVILRSGAVLLARRGPGRSHAGKWEFPGGRIEAGSQQDPTSPFISIPWNLPESGDWVLSAVAVPKNGGEALESAGVLIHVTRKTGSAPSSNLNPFPTP